MRAWCVSMARWTEGEDPEERYGLVLCLDKGASGDVWLARDKGNEEPVAIKIVPLDEADPELMEELDTELQALERCASDFVIKYFGAFQKDQNIWIVLEYAETGSLQDLVQYCMRPLNEAEIKAIMASLFSGLAYLQSVGIVHRDIKAKNILVMDDGRIKLADFGVAGFLKDKNDRRKTAVGSPHFMAPEVIEERPYDCRADVWAAGITALELAELEPPHAEQGLHWLLINVPTLDAPTLSNPSDWSAPFKSFLSECLTKDISRRKSARELLLHPFLATEVARQRGGDFSALKKIVTESVQHFMDAESLSKSSSSASQSADTAMPSLGKRVSSGIRRSLQRLSIGGGSKKNSNSQQQQQQQQRKTPRKSKKMALKEQKPTTPRFSKPAAVVKKNKKQSEARPPADSRASASDAYVQSLVEGPSEEELAERERRAEEIKRRLLNLYDKYGK